MATAAGGSVERGYTRPFGYPIAPTEFPTGGSATPERGRQAPSHGGAYTPQEEDTGCRSRRGGYLRRLSPKCLQRRISHGLVISRLKWSPHSESVRGIQRKATPQGCAQPRATGLSYRLWDLAPLPTIGELSHAVQGHEGSGRPEKPRTDFTVAEQARVHSFHIPTDYVCGQFSVTTDCGRFSKPDKFICV